MSIKPNDVQVAVDDYVFSLGKYDAANEVYDKALEALTHANERLEEEFSYLEAARKTMDQVRSDYIQEQING